MAMVSVLQQKAFLIRIILMKIMRKLQNFFEIDKANTRNTNMRSRKKYMLFCIFFCLAGLTLYAQEPRESETLTEQEPQKTEPAGFDEPVRVSAWKIIPHYYGLPVSVQLGRFYREENFSIFPNIGFSLIAGDSTLLNSSAGVSIRKKTVLFDAAAVYGLFPFTMNKPPAEQVAYGVSSFGFAFPKVTVTFPFQAGRQRRNRIAAAAETEPQVVTELSGGIRAEFFLADFGFFRSAGRAAMQYYWIAQGNFHYYTMITEIPASFHLYYVDFAFMYSFFHTRTVHYGNTAPDYRYDVERPQSGLTGRESFKAAVRYCDIHLFSAEFRWYPARLGAETNGFFISFFADAGIGITAAQKRNLLLEYGGGIGYTLYDSVPLTFQAGVNQDMQPVFYLSVVSRLSHRP